MRRALAADIPVLVGLMTDFYAEAGFQLDRESASASFAGLLDDERLGAVWLIDTGEFDIGHVVVTYRYAMEYGGLIACLDDLYVRPAWRNQGLASTALAEVRSFCKAAGVRALTVEVSPENGPAVKVYRRAGFNDLADRRLFAVALAPPAHTV